MSGDPPAVPESGPSAAPAAVATAAVPLPVPGAARAVALAAGLGALGLVWSYPLESVVAGPFTAHMLRHMTLVTLAAPLLVLGAPALRGPAWMTPLLASLLELVVVWGWHLPLLHDAARLSGIPFALEQLTFLVAGLAVWGSVLRPGRALGGAGALLLTSMHMTLLGALIVLAPAPLYLCTVEPALALDDQRLGGIVMLMIGTPVYLVGGLALVRQALAEPPVTADAVDAEIPDAMARATANATMNATVDATANATPDTTPATAVRAVREATAPRPPERRA